MAIDIRLVQVDALSHPTKLLVLKYAQRFYGVDREVIKRINPDPQPAPYPGEVAIVRQPAGIGASNVAFIGVQPLRDFYYPEIRNFARAAIDLANRQFPEFDELSMTLHGVGYGLDEVEALRSQIEGVFDALQAGSSTGNLRRVSILERDAGRVSRLAPEVQRLHLSHLDSNERDGTNRAAQLSAVPSLKAHAFVAMPFDSSYDDRYYYGIAPPLRSRGLVCERMDDLSFTGDIVQMMVGRIGRASLMVADVSTSNPNVYLEIGYAWACKIPVVLLCDESSKPLFDVRGHRHIRFTSIRDLETRLDAELRGLLDQRSAPDSRLG